MLYRLSIETQVINAQFVADVRNMGSDELLQSKGALLALGYLSQDLPWLVVVCVKLDRRNVSFSHHHS